MLLNKNNNTLKDIFEKKNSLFKDSDEENLEGLLVLSLRDIFSEIERVNLAFNYLFFFYIFYFIKINIFM